MVKNKVALFRARGIYGHQHMYVIVHITEAQNYLWYSRKWQL